MTSSSRTQDPLENLITCLLIFRRISPKIPGKLFLKGVRQAELQINQSREFLPNVKRNLPYNQRALYNAERKKDIARLENW